MQDETLENAITNLEIAENNLNNVLENSEKLDEAYKELINDSIQMMRKTLEELRTYEIQKEIQSYVDPE